MWQGKDSLNRTPRGDASPSRPALPLVALACAAGTAVALIWADAALARGFGGFGGFHGNTGMSRTSTFNTQTKARRVVISPNISKAMKPTRRVRVAQPPKYPGDGDGRRRPPRRPPVIVTFPGGPSGPIGPVGPGIVNLLPTGPAGLPPSAGGGAGGPPSGMPALDDRRYVPDEVLVAFAADVRAQAIVTFAQSQRLALLGVHRLPLINTVLYRFRITDRRLVSAVMGSVQGDRRIANIQPNFLYRLRQESTRSVPAGDAFQYVLSKLNVAEAHGIATGNQVPVAVIDSAIDQDHPELRGIIAARLDFGAAVPGHAHGTAMASAIAAHGRLLGLAPAVRILAARAFDASAVGAQGTSTRILDGLQWAVNSGARVVNMSFTGPADRKLHEIIAAARQRGVVLVAAAGNDGPQAPEAYPAAYPEVIAVTATDADDKSLAVANRGSYVAVAAPGVDIFVAAPNGGYDYSTGTSVAAAHVSGLAALLIERNPGLTPDAIRAILVRTARDLGPPGRDDEFGAGLVNAYDALLTQSAVTAERTPSQ